MKLASRAAGAGLLLLTVLALGGCRGCKEAAGPAGRPRAAGPVECPKLNGTWKLGYQTTCASKAGTAQIWGMTEIAQQGCNFRLKITGLGLFEGDLSGNNASFQVTFEQPCFGNAQGNFTVKGNMITGGFDGVSRGSDPRCCNQINGTFTLMKTTPPNTPTPAAGAAAASPTAPTTK